MGDAKRRKKLDPDYGKVPRTEDKKDTPITITINNRKPRLQIDVSRLTGNFLINCSYCGFCIDSASKRKDAEKLLNAVMELLQEYPINTFDEDNWKTWMYLHHAKIPDVDAVMFTIPAGKDRNKILDALIKKGDSDKLQPEMASEILGFNAES